MDDEARGENNRRDTDVAARISETLQKRKRRNRVRSRTWKTIRIAAAAVVVCIAGLLVYRYWDVLKPSSFQAVVRLNENSTKYMKIGGALDIIAGNTTQFAAFHKGMVSVTTETVRYATESGSGSYQFDVRLQRPALSVSGGYYMVYDRAGTALHLADRNGVCGTAVAEGSLIDIQVNAAGYSAAVTEQSGYLTGVHVYDAALKKVFSWKTPDYYVLTAVLAEDRQSLAAAVYRVEDAVLRTYVLLFDIRKEGVAAQIPLGSAHPLLLNAASAGIGILTEDAYLRAQWDGTIYAHVSLEGEPVYGAVRDGENGLFVISETGKTDTRYGIRHFNADGVMTAQSTTDTRIRAVAAAAGQIALLTDTDIRIYDSTLRPIRTVLYETEVTHILLLKDHTLVVYTDERIYLV